MSAKRPRSRRGRILSLLLLSLVAAGVGFASLKKEPPLEVETTLVEVGEVREVIASAASGEVKPARRVGVRSEIPGTVKRVLKRRGERVKQGELVVAFDAEELGARVEQARVNVETAALALKAAETRLETTRRAAARAKTLSTGGAIAPAELERAETELSAAEIAIDQAKSARKQAEVAQKLAMIAVDRAEVRAPFAGVLHDVSAEVGVQLAIASPLFDLIDDSEIYVEIPIDEGDAAKVFMDQEVRIETDAARATSIAGKVRFIPPAVGRSPASGATLLEGAAVATKKDRFLYVEVTPEAGAQLRVGASVNAELLVRAKPDVIFVPTHAVIGRGAERQVWTIDGGKAKALKFKAGLTSWERTEVLSGLSSGLKVISSLNAKGLKEGAPVRER